MKGTPYLNPDPFCRFIGPRNWGEALIDDKLTTCLLDNGSQLNFVTPTYARERGMDILSLDTLAREIGGQLPPIAVMGGGMIKPEGFVIMNQNDQRKRNNGVSRALGQLKTFLADEGRACKDESATS